MSESSSRRVLRVQKSIRDILSLYLIARYQHALNIMISIPDVQVSSDLRNARVLVSTLVDAADASHVVEVLNEDLRDIQSYLNSQLKMKFCPRVKFVPDTSYKIHEKLKQISKEN